MNGEALHWFGKRRRGPLTELTRLSAHPDPSVREELVWALAGWSTPGVAELLDHLADDLDSDVREAVEAVVRAGRSEGPVRKVIRGKRLRP